MTGSGVLLVLVLVIELPVLWCPLVTVSEGDDSEPSADPDKDSGGEAFVMVLQ